MKINHILYINLDKNINRRLFIENGIRRLNISSTRIAGVEPNNFLNYPIIPSIPHGSLRHKGTVGCFLGHKNCYDYISQYGKDNENYLIVEDDAILRPGLIEEIESLPHIPSCDILFLNSCCLYKSFIPPDPKYLYKDNIYHIYTGYPIFNGGHAYIINKETANLILDKIKKITTYEEPDVFLFKNFKCFTYVTKLLKVSLKFKSDRWPEAPYNNGREDG